MTEAAYYTEVHNINGDGENAGVVYCEMQVNLRCKWSILSFENHPSYIQDFFIGTRKHCWIDHGSQVSRKWRQPSSDEIDSMENTEIIPPPRFLFLGASAPCTPRTLATATRLVDSC